CRRWPTGPYNTPAMPDSTVQAFSELPTAAISDALDALGIATQPIGIKPLSPSFRLAGRAWTLKYRAIGEVERGTVGDYIDDIQPGDVIVLDNNGKLDRTVWGDILTLCAHKRGVAGTVIDGICRDVARAIELNYPIYSRGHWMRTGKDRVEVDSTQVPVSLGDVQVRPGDIIIGDADGI